MRYVCVIVPRLHLCELSCVVLCFGLVAFSFPFESISFCSQRPNRHAHTHCTLHCTALHRAHKNNAHNTHKEKEGTRREEEKQ